MGSKIQVSYTNEYKKYIACSFGYKLECIDKKFGKPFKLFLHKDTFTILFKVWLKKAKTVVI